jgi:DNA-3-methyladenine glycosylase
MKFSENGRAMIPRSNIETGHITNRISRDFFARDVLEVAPDILCKDLVTILADGSVVKFPVTDVEAYRGHEDKACHASKGKTPRTEVMFGQGGHLYVYLIYGMYWMLNIVTGDKGSPQALLIRGIADISGPGKITKKLAIDSSYYGEDLVTSGRIWLEDTGIVPAYKTGPRIGIDYAGDYWKSIPWRYYL